ncbi:MAG: hypothetical protein QOF35_1679 [Actinomycetota bacterium]|jgi:hypothetical protein|nr:hypothetical protein [Actinomycetota bacterium]
MSRERERRHIRAGVAAIVVIVAAGTAAQLIDFEFFDLRIAALNSAADGGVFGVVGDLSLSAAALAAWLVLVRTRDQKATTILLPPLLTFLAVDKAMQLHDHIPHWLALYLPLLAVTFAVLASVAWRLPAPESQLVWTGLVLLAVSFVLHLFGDQLLRAFDASVTGWAYQVKAVVKHGAEVAGWLLVALGLAAGTEARRQAGSGPELPAEWTTPAQ